MKTTTSTLPRADSPISHWRRSVSACSSSSAIKPSGSSNAVAASLKPTPCLSEFRRAFSESHSYRAISVYIAIDQKFMGPAMPDPRFCRRARVQGAPPGPGLLRLARTGGLRAAREKKGLRVVCVLTGHGLKDPDTPRSLPSRLRTIPAAYAPLRRLLA